MSEKSDNQSVYSTSTTASGLFERFKQVHNLDKENKNDEDREKLERLKTEMKNIIKESKESKEDLEIVKSELRNMLNDDDENIKVTDEEYNQILEEIGISSKEEEEEEERAEEEEEERAEEEAEEVKATLSTGEIANKLKEDYKYNDVNIEIKDDKIEVTAKPPPPAALGGKSKKKQMKPKNKSNKKMKKKQTKKGGKQIKKRSLKRKMKK
tara:strand:+ start:20159 stop:20791 length:633 start_codon:yes stop_codon:yes gene_type:complete